MSPRSANRPDRREEGRQSRMALFRRMVREADIPRTSLLLLGIFSLAGCLIQMRIPLLLGQCLDAILGAQGPGGADFLSRSLVLLGGFYLLSAVCGILQGRVGAAIGPRAARALRDRAAEKIMRLPAALLDTRPTGDFISRIQNDVESMTGGLAQFISGPMVSLLSVLICFFSLLWIHPTMALINLVTSVLTLAITFFLSPLVRRHAMEKQQAVSRSVETVNHSLKDFLTLTVLGGLPGAGDRFGRVSADLKDHAASEQFTRSAMEPALMSCGSLNFICVTVVGCLALIDGTLSVGHLQSCILFSRLLFRNLNDLGTMVVQIHGALASAP